MKKWKKRITGRKIKERKKVRLKRREGGGAGMNEGKRER